jgi:hypothetical protein
MFFVERRRSGLRAEISQQEKFHPRRIKNRAEIDPLFTPTEGKSLINFVS